MTLVYITFSLLKYKLATVDEILRIPHEGDKLFFFTFTQFIVIHIHNSLHTAYGNVN